MNPQCIACKDFHDAHAGMAECLGKTAAQRDVAIELLLQTRAQLMTDLPEPRTPPPYVVLLAKIDELLSRVPQ
jgi:hypothetical protein